MDTFNHLISSFFDLAFSPFSIFEPLIGLMVVSIVTGIIMLIIFRYTSNQSAIRRIKNRIKAHFLEIRLYKDDLGAMMEAQKHILRYNLTYMKHSLKPMLFLMIPVVLIMIQMSLWFDRYPLEPGKEIIVKLAFENQAQFNEDALLKTPEGISVETPPLRIKEEKAIYWRIKALNPGKYYLEFILNSDILNKIIVVDDRLARLSVKKVSPNLLQQVLYPAEKSFPKNLGIDYIEINYPSISYNLFGFQIHWLVIFFVVSILTGFLLKKVFRVEI